MTAPFPTFIAARASMSGMPVLACAPIPICGIRVIAFNSVKQGMDPVKERVTLVHLADLMRVAPIFAEAKVASLQEIERCANLRI